MNNLLNNILRCRSMLFRLACLALLCLFAAGFSSCRKEKVYKIGVSQCSADDWREKMNDEIRREIMLHEDAEVEIRSADDDSQRQIADIRYFRDNGFDIIIVAPNEAAALTPVISEVHDKGIPVIVFDRNINGDSYNAFIGADNDMLGRSAAHYALHLAGPQATAIEIYGLRGSTPAEGRHNGFRKEFEKGGGRLLGGGAGDWNKDDAIPVVDSLLDLYPDVDVIYAHNDRMAIGASEVASRRGIRDRVKIIGIDAAPAIGIQAVADSVIDATFLYPTEGHRIIRTALSILKGEDYPRRAILPVASAVDKSNADILLLQNEALKEETGKMQVLKRRIDDYWAQHSSQTFLFYASVAIIVLMLGVVFLVLRVYWQHKRHQAELVERNHLLEEERDKQKHLNEALEEATQSKLMFFTNVSHDLRTPLTLIAEPVAQLAAADNLTPQQHSLIKIADRNVRILRRLINQILDFRKYENNKLDLRLTETDLGAAMADWLEAFRSVARKRNLRLSLVPPADGSKAVLAVDIEKMERVFFNLVSNAFKYTPDNGEITVGYSVGEDSVTIRVADTGEGISERDLGNIFDRFYQVDRVHPNGSGIGLSLSKAFVEMHGGKIAVESTLKKGSVFTVTLPVRHVAEEVVPVESNITSETVNAELDVTEQSVEFADEKPLVLVIDDNKDMQQLVSSVLGSDYNVLTASNGAEGVRRAMKYVPDVVVCDVMMPVMDGLECCRILKSEVATSHIPVLMLTACSMDEQRVQGYDSGADGYLSKPFSADVLLARIKSLIANRARIMNGEGNVISARKPDNGAKPTGKKEAKGTSASGSGRPELRQIDSDFYNRFLEIFNAGMGNAEMSVDWLAQQMGLERSQFYRKIKSLTNYSPVELMRKLRLAAAREMLTTTEKTVSEIAYETGFSTPAYFTKCYRDAYGETPTTHRSRLS